jgi:hypothetical protein
MSPSCIFSSDSSGGVKQFRFLGVMTASMVGAAVVVSVAFLTLLDRSNEFYIPSIDTLLKTDDILWGPLFLQNTAGYKFRRALLKKPELLVLGSSTVSQFRDQATPGIATYNASRAAGSFVDALSFVRSLYPQHRPRVTILGIDSWWFARDKSAEGAVPNDPTGEFSQSEQLANMLREIVKIRFLTKLIFSPPSQEPDELGGRKPVGYNAAALASGFRPDGSYQYGAILLDRYPYYNQAKMGYRHGFKHSRDQVRRKVGRFEYTGEPSAKAVELLRQIIRYHQEQSVGLILIFPPLAHAVYSAAQETPAQRRYFTAIETLMRTVAADYGVEFFNYRDYATLGVADRQSIDGIHIDEIGSLHLMRDLAKKSGTLRRVLSPDTRAAMDRIAQRVKLGGRHSLAP